MTKFKETQPVSLRGYKLKDRYDIIRHIVNKEDRADPKLPPIPTIYFQRKKFSLAKAWRTFWSIMLV
jgi:hypothetical protein